MVELFHTSSWCFPKTIVHNLFFLLAPSKHWAVAASGKPQCESQTLCWWHAQMQIMHCLRLGPDDNSYNRQGKDCPGAVKTIIYDRYDNVGKPLSWHGGRTNFNLFNHVLIFSQTQRSHTAALVCFKNVDTPDQWNIETLWNPSQALRVLWSWCWNMA